MNLTEAGITIERQFITGNEENSPEFYKDSRKILSLLTMNISYELLLILFEEEKSIISHV